MATSRTQRSRRGAAATVATTVSGGTRPTTTTSAASRSASRATASATAPPSAAGPRPRSRRSSTSSTTSSTPAFAPRRPTPSSSASRTGSPPSSETSTPWRTLTGQARKWIYPRIGATKLKDFSATDAVKFFQQIAPFLSKRTLVMIKSTLRRSIRRAQVHDLIGRNVIELIDLPAGKPGRPSRAMTQDQAAKVLKTANGGPTGYVKVVKASSGRTAQPTPPPSPASSPAAPSRTGRRRSPR